MKWLQELNEVVILESGMVQFDVFAEGEGLEVSLNNESFISPNIEKNGYNGFRFWVNPNSIKPNEQGIKLQNFWVKEWGCLIVPETDIKPREIAIEVPKTQSVIAVDSNEGMNKLWSKGCVGFKYGSDYWKLLDELNGGESIFEFHGQNVEYPKPYTNDDSNLIQATDELVAINLPSHSVTAIWGHKDARSGIDIQIQDANRNTIFSLHDTKGGLHPVANAIGESPGPSQRGNNHPDNCNRWIKYGYYTVIFSNLSIPTESDDFELTCKIEDTSGKAYFSEKLKAGYSRMITVELSPLENKYHAYKINCNYLPK